MSVDVPHGPRSGEFFAPLPLVALALLVTNDVWLKPAFHSAVTGKLSDVALCFLLPLFFSEVLGLVFGLAPRVRLALGALAAGALFATLEIVPLVTHVAIDALTKVGPYVGLTRRFRMTSDGTDLFCLLLIPAAVAYGRRRLGLSWPPTPSDVDVLAAAVRRVTTSYRRPRP